jgi:Putative Ig domain
MQTDVRRAWALATVAGLVLAACAAPQNLSSTSPQPSSSPTEEASPSPSPSPIPTAPLAISSFAFHTGEVGLSYSAVSLGATGGLAPYSWSLTSGSLPPGLTLSSGGVVSGSNTSSGTFSFTLKVSDAGGATVSQNGAITVYSALTMTQPCVGQCVIGKGCTTCGAFGTASRGLSPYTYKIVGGAVPPGMTWKQLSLVGGFPAGRYSLSVQVTDKLGARVTVSANWSIYSPPKFTKGSSCAATGSPASCSTTGWTYSGGSPTATPKLVIISYGQYCPSFTFCYPKPTAPPPRWSVSVRSGVVTFSADIECSDPTLAYQGYVIVELLDTAKCATTSPSNAASLLVDLVNNC